LEYRKIGATALEVSVLGFGLGTISTEGWGKIDEAESLTLLREARDLGITFFDTAEFFGQGYGEEILSKALRGHRHEVIIGTKVIYDSYHTGSIKESGSGTSGEYLLSAAIKQACERSLRRLQTDYIDLYQIATPLSYLNTEERQDLFEILDTLTKEGKIRYIGVASDPLDLEYWQVSYNDAQSIQTPYNILEQNVLTQVLLNQEMPLVGTIISIDSHKQDLLFGKSDQYSALGYSNVEALTLTPGTVLKLEKLTEVSKRWELAIETLASMFCLDNAQICTIKPDITGTYKLRKLINSTTKITMPEELREELYNL